MAVLTCGEGGSTGSEVLAQINTNTTDIADTETRVTLLEGYNALVLNAESRVASQQPSGTDTALQITYGDTQSNSVVSLSSAGAVTFNEAGKYSIHVNAHYGREGASGVSILFFRFLLNGNPLGYPLVGKIDQADTLIPWAGTLNLELEEDDVLTTELLRDSDGNNSGGLFSTTSSVAGWGQSSCIAMNIYKVR